MLKFFLKHLATQVSKDFKNELAVQDGSTSYFEFNDREAQSK